MFPNLTVRESLEMGRIASGRIKRSRLEEVLEYFPRLRERLAQASGTLSGGEQQMLAIGRGLMTDPRIMLLDEPSDGVMPLLVQQIAEILKEINRREKVTMVIVEQNVPLLFSMTDRCIILEKGAVVASGSREDVSSSEVMKEYLAI
jgi:branched-chain amino acid transport system ATP-binding protein